MTLSSTSLEAQYSDLSAYSNEQFKSSAKIADAEFRSFMDLFKTAVDSQHSRQDLQHLFRRVFFGFVVGYLGIAATVGFGLYAGISRWMLYPLVFIAGYWMTPWSTASVHARVHHPNTTGWKVLDKLIDVFSVTLCGWSVEIFKRGHLYAHYREIGILSKAFFNDHMVIEKVPLNFYGKPWALWGIYFNQAFCEREHINRRMILAQTLLLHLYYVLVVAELLSGSCFLLVGHVLPAILFTASIAFADSAVHSSPVSENTFHSVGCLYGPDTQGLYRLPVTVINAMTLNFALLHIFHHAYPQLPTYLLSSSDADQWRRYLLEHHPNLRYCRVMTHEIHEQTLSALGKPTLLDYVIQSLVLMGCYGLCSLMVCGYIPEASLVVMEHFLVDYRLGFKIIQRDPEVMQNFNRYLETLGIPQAYAAQAQPSKQLRGLHKVYTWSTM